MDMSFIGLRIAKLRNFENISARELSLRLGQSNSYITAIENGKSVPSMEMFLVICDYFKITPAEFFEEGNEYPIIKKDIIKELDKLSSKSLESVLYILKEMNRRL